MKHGRHLCACIVALILAFACFVGCGGGGTEGGEGGNGGGNEGGNTPATPSATPVRLELSGMKTSFEFGEAFSAGGLVVTVRYSNGTREVAKEGDYQVNSSAYNAQEAGEYEIVVHMNALSERYTVTVGAKPVDWRDDGVLRILLVGTSFSEDTFTHMYSICESLGIEAEIGVLWYVIDFDTIINGITQNKPNFEFWLASSKTYGAATRQAGKTMSEILKAREWDFVTIHQRNFYIVQEHGMDDLQRVVELLRGELNESAQIAHLMTWAYRELNEGETGEGTGIEDSYEGYRTYFNSDQMTMYRRLTSAIEEKVASTGMPVVPIGTAVQNARTSYMGDTLTRDLVHLSGGMGRYLAAMTTLRYLAGVDFPAPDKVPEFLKDRRAYDLMVESVTHAISNPYMVTTSVYTD